MERVRGGRTRPRTGVAMLAWLWLAALLCCVPGCMDEPAGGPEADEPAGGPATGAPVVTEGDGPPTVAQQETPEGAAAAEWDCPRFGERRDERYEMVRRHIGRDAKIDARAVEAMRQVPRHMFVPAGGQRSAYADHPLPIGHGQTISQPSLVAYMTSLLDLEPGHSVLEIGTGSGYQAAVLSELTPNVYTIEIIEALADTASARFEKLGYWTIRTKCVDGYYGWQEHAPFDAVIVTAAAGHVPPPLVAQLKPGGRMVIPVGGVFEVQHIMLITKDAEGKTKARSILPVRFVPMTGRAQKRQ